MKSFLGLSLAGLLMGIAAEVRAGDGCDQCGCCEVRKVCKVQCGTKKVKKTVWGCKCEDVCLPGYIKGGDCCKGGHGCGGLKGLFAKHHDRCDGCIGGCDAISCGGHCQGDCCRDVAPCDVSHCKVRTRKKLIRYEIEEEVPVYEWKVEYACGCGAGCCDIGGPGPTYGGPSPIASPPVEAPPVEAQPEELREAPPPPPPFDAARSKRSLLRTVFR